MKLEMSELKLPIYLDSHATTPVDKRVFDVMKPYFFESFGNASSIDHSFGYDASIGVQLAREKIARLIGAKTDEIIFTSGATESDNIALTGVMEKNKEKGNHIITCKTEHKAILDCARYLENNGYKVTYLDVDEFGLINLEELKSTITEQTVLISIMFANNEIGTIANVKEIGDIAHDRNIFFHTDAAQAFGHIPIDVKNMNIDLMSVSSHKIYGPKGIGALYLRSLSPSVRVNSIIHGGGQEKNIRSGTLNVPGIVGFGEAAEIAGNEMHAENSRFAKWTKLMLEEFSQVGGKLNGHLTQRLSHNLNVRFEKISGKSIINNVSQKLAISAASACTTQTVEPSHVLMALGLTEKQAHSSVRFGLSRFNTQEEIDFTIEEITRAVKHIERTKSM